MGLFNNYNKPGPGVNKNEKKKKGLILFFELLTRKFGAYITLNLVYLLTLIPGIIAVWFSLMFCLSDLVQTQEGAAALVTITSMLSILIAILFSLSPCSSGYYYVLRNFSREDNAWEFTDFWGKFKANAGKSIIAFIIDTLLVCVSFLAIRIYIIAAALMGSVAIFMLGGFLLILLLFMLSIPYKWIMTVTFDISLWSIHKNSFLLLFIDAKRNGLYLLSVIFFWFVMYLLSTVSAGLITIIVLALIGISAYGLVLCLNTYPTIKKYLIDSQEK